MKVQLNDKLIESIDAALDMKIHNARRHYIDEYDQLKHDGMEQRAVEYITECKADLSTFRRMVTKARSRV